MGGKSPGKWQPDTYGLGKSWGHCWEPRSKTIAAIIFVIGVVSLNSLNLLLVNFFFILLVALSMGLPFSFLLTRMLWGIPFIVLMAVTLVFGNGLPIELDRLTFAALITLKALTSILIMIILLGTQPIQRYFDGIAHMKLPSVIISVLFLSYRYVYLFRDQLVNTQRALAARIFQPGVKRKSLAVYGEMAGGLFLKALDRSEKVSQAMAARGFNGKIHTGPPLPISRTDLLKCSITLILAVLLIILDWRWLG